MKKTWTQIANIKFEHLDKLEKKEGEGEIDKPKGILEIVKYTCEDMALSGILEE